MYDFESCCYLRVQRTHRIVDGIRTREKFATLPRLWDRVPAWGLATFTAASANPQAGISCEGAPDHGSGDAMSEAQEYVLGQSARAARRLEIQDAHFAETSERMLDELSLRP